VDRIVEGGQDSPESDLVAAPVDGISPRRVYEREGRT
jgi:hypothetical protein